MVQLLLPFDELVPIRDGDPDARAMYERHYSARRYRDGRKTAKLVGPGEYLLLTTPQRDALIAFRVSHRPIAGQYGIYLSVFRNESCRRASELVRAACAKAWHRWPGRPIFTLVDPRRVTSGVPGYCFRRAGFQRTGTTRRGLLVFTRQPPTPDRKSESASAELESEPIICTRCYLRRAWHRHPCPACGNPEFGLPGSELDHFDGGWRYWCSRKYLPERRGQGVRVLLARRGKYLVEFEDGWQAVTVRGTFRKAWRERGT